MVPGAAGATFVGTEECALCHEETVVKFATSTHARLRLQNDAAMDIGCEACHGPGSVHVQNGGGLHTMVNPGTSPEACFQCHLDKRAQFSLPNTHPVLSGHMSCNDCHDPHEGNAVRGTGEEIEREIETCSRCHTGKNGPYVYEHGAMREGCQACHNPHGSINQRMLLARDANLCLRCHLLAPTPGSSGEINANAIGHTSENHNTRLMQGTCWSAGCHEDPHGSNASYHFRY
jgi:DmsE family decaheme c-type cytochrome